MNQSVQMGVLVEKCRKMMIRHPPEDKKIPQDDHFFILRDCSQVIAGFRQSGGSLFTDAEASAPIRLR